MLSLLVVFLAGDVLQRGGELHGADLPLDLIPEGTGQLEQRAGGEIGEVPLFQFLLNAAKLFPV